MDTNDASDALDLAALAAPNMSPVLGRYMDRSWSHGVGHRLFDTAGNSFLDFANGIAVTALGHTHPRVTAAIHAQVDRLIGPVHAIGFAEVESGNRWQLARPDRIGQRSQSLHRTGDLVAHQPGQRNADTKQHGDAQTKQG